MIEVVLTSACSDCHDMLADVIFDGQYVSVDHGYSPAAVTGLVDAVMDGIMPSPTSGPARADDGGECWLCGSLEADRALDLYRYCTLTPSQRDDRFLPTLVAVARLLEHDCYTSDEIVQAAALWDRKGGE